MTITVRHAVATRESALTVRRCSLDLMESLVVFVLPLLPAVGASAQTTMAAALGEVNTKSWVNSSRFRSSFNTPLCIRRRRAGSASFLEAGAILGLSFHGE
jgi:hypothetical protein